MEPKKVRCKFRCDEITKTASPRYNHETGQYEPRTLYGARLSPVTGGSDENESFFEATPCGRFEVSSIVPDFFEPGREYFLDVSVVE